MENQLPKDTHWSEIKFSKFSRWRTAIIWASLGQHFCTIFGTQMEKQLFNETHWSCFRKSRMADGVHLEFRFWAIIWASIKISGTVMENQQPKTTYGSIIRFSTIQHARHLESHYVIPTTQFRIEILHIIWYLDGKLFPDDGIFKLAIRDKFNTAAATILHFVFRCIIHSPMNTFLHNISYSHRKYVSKGDPYVKIVMQDGGWP